MDVFETQAEDERKDGKGRAFLDGVGIEEDAR
jgi:hypothetical protein